MIASKVVVSSFATRLFVNNIKAKKDRLIVFDFIIMFISFNIKFICSSIYFRKVIVNIKNILKGFISILKGKND
ncbi:hypothetical protein GCM10007985_02920 [Aliarcobacter butzleri]|nr:hypothetical protein GCM10007985_02920 [Aliarcobacter butzleri]